jgi:hypothetical protein
VNKLFGVVLVVVALAIALVPAFTDCQSQGKSITLANGKTIPMKCHWTAKAEIGVGAPMLAVGAMLGFSRRKSALFSLSLVGAVLGAAAILVPNTLIGVCASGMPCHTVMQPTLTVLGGVAIAASIGGFIISRKALD